MPYGEACLSQMRTLTVTVSILLVTCGREISRDQPRSAEISRDEVTVSILLVTPTTVYAVAVISDWHQKPDHEMPTGRSWEIVGDCGRLTKAGPRDTYPDQAGEQQPAAADRRQLDRLESRARELAACHAHEQGRQDRERVRV